MRDVLHLMGLRAAMLNFRALLTVLAVSAALAGCGDSGGGSKQAAGKAPVAPRGIYISTNDCIEGKMLNADQCSALIESAIAMHEARAAKYDSIISCSRAEGPDRCERTVNRTFSPRLQAFFVIASEQPTALPLYATGGGETGFKTLSKQIVDIRSDHLTISTPALALAHENARLPVSDAAYAKAGASATDIR